MLAITGQRREEVAAMTQSELDGATWTIRGARTKNKRTHAVPLPSLAQEEIARVKSSSGAAGYVFSTSGQRPVSGFSKVKARLDAAMQRIAPPGAIITPWRLHDLRRTAATGMQRAGADLHIVERVLNHESGSFGGIVSVYQKHKFQPEVRAALEAWSNLLRDVVGELPRNVVPMRA